MIRRQVIGASLCIGILGGILIHTWLTAHPTKVVYAAEPEQPRVVQIEVVIDWTKDRINKEIEDVAVKYGVSASEMKRVIKCESQGSTTIQSRHRRPDGSRERSFGLVQIYLPAHPDVTYEQAVNPKFAIDFMAKNFKEGRQRMWSCY
jgi:hypothetical protein